MRLLSLALLGMLSITAVAEAPAHAAKPAKPSLLQRWKEHRAARRDTNRLAKLDPKLKAARTLGELAAFAKRGIPEMLVSGGGVAAVYTVGRMIDADPLFTTVLASLMVADSGGRVLGAVARGGQIRLLETALGDPFLRPRLSEGTERYLDRVGP
jgi:hypothetical protein